MPKVSVIMNCYNGEKYLKDAIDSIYAQSFMDWEIIFFDNSSTDNSAVIAHSYDKRLKYYCSGSTVTLGCARRLAVEKAQGEWIAFLDTDDIWYPHKLKRQLHDLESGSYLFCYAGIRYIDCDGHAIRPSIPMHSSGDLLAPLLSQFEVNMVTPMVHRSVFDEMKLTFEDSFTASEEYNLFIRIASKGHAFVSNEILGDYRVYSGSLTGRQIHRWAIERRLTLKQLTVENPGIEQIYASSFKRAIARADYYEARYLIFHKEYSQARSVLKQTVDSGYIYRFLLMISYIPWLWNAIHGNKVKRLLLFVRKIM